jgi:hypothetical protein
LFLFFSCQIWGSRKASIYVPNDLSILMEGEGGQVVNIALYSLAEALSDLQ